VRGPACFTFTCARKARQASKARRGEKGPPYSADSPRDLRFISTHARFQSYRRRKSITRVSAEMSEGIEPYWRDYTVIAPPRAASKPLFAGQRGEGSHRGHLLRRRLRRHRPHRQIQVNPRQKWVGNLNRGSGIASRRTSRRTASIASATWPTRTWPEWSPSEEEAAAVWTTKERICKSPNKKHYILILNVKQIYIAIKNPKEDIYWLLFLHLLLGPVPHVSPEELSRGVSRNAISEDDPASNALEICNSLIHELNHGLANALLPGK